LDIESTEGLLSGGARAYTVIEIWNKNSQKEIWSRRDASLICDREISSVQLSQGPPELGSPLVTTPNALLQKARPDIRGVAPDHRILAVIHNPACDIWVTRCQLPQTFQEVWTSEWKILKILWFPRFGEGPAEFGESI